MEQIHLSIFTTRILDCFCQAKKQTCEKIIQLSNQDVIDLDEISYVYSHLTRLSELEVRFLQFVNSSADKVTNNEIENYKNFYKKFTEGRFM